MPRRPFLDGGLPQKQTGSNLTTKAKTKYLLEHSIRRSQSNPGRLSLSEQNPNFPFLVSRICPYMSSKGSTTLSHTIRCEHCTRCQPHLQLQHHHHSAKLRQIHQVFAMLIMQSTSIVKVSFPAGETSQGLANQTSTATEKPARASTLIQAKISGIEQAGADDVANGGQILSELANRAQPLSDEEVGVVVAYLNTAWRSRSQNGLHEAYRSRDLNLGHKVELPQKAAQRLEEMKFLESGFHTACEQFDPHIQQAAFDFVKSDVRIELGLICAQPWIRIKGIKRTFYPFQLYGAFYLLHMERGPRRGMLEADSMGLGKVSCLDYCTTLDSGFRAIY